MANRLLRSSFRKVFLVLPFLMIHCAKKSSDTTEAEPANANPLPSTEKASAASNSKEAESNHEANNLLSSSVKNILYCDSTIPANADWTKKNCEAVQGWRKDPVFLETLSRLEKDGETFLDICTKTVDCSTISATNTATATPGTGSTLGSSITSGLGQIVPIPTTTSFESAISSAQKKMTPEEVAKIAGLAGFQYEPTQDIYVTKVDALQRYAGYREIIDVAATPVGMVIDTEPITFPYNGTTYMVELWKGQYYASTGSEIGIYKKKGIGWSCAGDDDMLQMSYALTKNGQTIFKRNGKHWWLTGFKPGVFSEPHELVMDNIQITFKDPVQRDGFLAGLHAAGYEDKADAITTHGNTVGFRFTNTKTKQPWTRKQSLNVIWQTTNKTSAKSFGIGKALVGRTDNSPETISLICQKVLGYIKVLPTVFHSVAN